MSDSPLLPFAYRPLPLGSIRPRGWLQNQLNIQADSLTGHLDEFWPSLKNSQWIGGSGEGWERGPYYADGLLPLAYQLRSDRLIAKAHRWVNAFMDLQNDDGWIGPVQHSEWARKYDCWPNMIVYKVLTQYHEVTGDARALETLLRYARWLQNNLEQYPLEKWEKQRWPDNVIGLHWLYETTGEAWLLDVAAKLHEQGFDWTNYFTEFPYREKLKHDDTSMITHVVNNAMGVKAPAVWYRQSHNAADRDGVAQGLANYDTYHGQVTGVFTGDEHLAGREPFQGTELCAVVELMFSLEQAFAVLGDPALAERLERVTYNALPATFSPDMWTHQYDQQANQVLCRKTKDYVWTTNRSESNLFGLQPHFGCCCANMHQGWPKFVSHLWMQAPDGGPAALTYAPCEVNLKVNNVHVQLVVDTAYPFDEGVQIHVNTATRLRFPLHLRVPQWTSGHRLTVNNQPVEAPCADGYCTLEREWVHGDTVGLYLPMPIQTHEREHGAVSVTRGPLVYSMPVPEKWQLVRDAYPYALQELHPTADWNYGLEVDDKQPADSFTVEQGTLGPVPFTPEQPPVRLRAKGRKVPGWGLECNAAAPVPEAPVSSTRPREDITLIPYGSTNLRVTEFPRLQGS